MSTLGDKVKTSIERLKAFEPEDGYYLAFSGGKDSVVCKALLDMAGVKYDSTYRLTSVDPPELVHFIKRQHPDVMIDIPRYKDGSQKTMWNLILRKKSVPTRVRRFCCEELKEHGGDGRLVVTGVRWAESFNRKSNQDVVTIRGKGAKKQLSDAGGFSENTKGGYVMTYDNDDTRRVVTQCYRTLKTTLNPIVDWEDKDVWGFIRGEKVPYCELYDEGFDRLGCIGCPAAAKRRYKEFARWPTYKEAYIHTCDKLVKALLDESDTLRATGIRTGGELFHWWMEDGVVPGQISLFDNDDDY